MTRKLRAIGHEDRLSLVEHLDELRSRLILCVIAFFVTFSFCYWQNDELLSIVNRPLEATQNVDGKERSKDPLEQSATYALRSGEAQRALVSVLRNQQAINDSLSKLDGLSVADRARLSSQQVSLRRAERAFARAAAATPTNRKRQPVTLGVAEPFVTTFTVAGYAALLLSLPFLLYQAYAFVLPAFSPKERRAAVPLMLMVPVLFVAGVVFGYYLALPRAIDFLQNFNDDNFDILVQARDYYRFSILLLAVIGLLFQIPVGVLAVTRLGIVTPRQLAKNRGYILLGVAVIAAVATPTPDPVTMIIAMAPLVVLFELSVLLARIVEGRGSDREDDWDIDEDDDDDLVRDGDVRDDVTVS